MKQLRDKSTKQRRDLSSIAFGSMHYVTVSCKFSNWLGEEMEFKKFINMSFFLIWEFSQPMDDEQKARLWHMALLVDIQVVNFVPTKCGM